MDGIGDIEFFASCEWAPEEVTSSKEFYNTMVLAKKEYETKTVFPPRENIFEALKLTSYENTRVVIVN